MRENGMYLGTEAIYQKIRDVGGKWNDTKERPIVCLIESTERTGLYWAIPVGNWNHRDTANQQRVTKFMSYDDKDLRSCYYHTGKTTTQSIFFISDVIPITDKYIEREYKGYDKKIYIIKNPHLIQALTYKLKRILAFEASRNNYFRQHITDVKNALITELDEEQQKDTLTSI